MLPTAYEKKCMFDIKTTMTLIITNDEARICLNILLHELRTETNKNIFIKSLYFPLCRNA